LLGQALRKALGVIARQQGRGRAEVAVAAGAAVLGRARLKAALALDGDDPAAREQALALVLHPLEAVEGWLDTPPVATDPLVASSLAIAQQVQAQDVCTNDAGQRVLGQGVARDRRLSVEEGQMRHGRTSRRVRVDGDQRHVRHDLDSGLVRAVGVTAANAPEAGVTDELQVDLASQGLARDDLAELHIDRAYLSSTWVRARPATLAIYGKAWPVRNGSRFPKTAFTLDGRRQTLRCPHAVELPFIPGGTVHFPGATCAACPLRVRCTTSARGRSVHVHPDEQLLQELRQR